MQVTKNFNTTSIYTIDFSYFGLINNLFNNSKKYMFFINNKNKKYFTGNIIYKYLLSNNTKYLIIKFFFIYRKK